MQDMKYDLYKGPEYYRACDHQAVQSALIVDSQFTTSPNDMDVFRIVQIDPRRRGHVADVCRRGAWLAERPDSRMVQDGKSGRG